ncbi:hypothetical protein LWI29_030506 [Acer saccharum]|uniref:Uncharacterized protein n=1 Tax=Acer saccharum TaxID=4024 RepID=A0AA39SNC1_ACESA|nr:hypothetical protein LWI29_030506 [Acer saccharum]
MDHSTRHQLFCRMMRAIELNHAVEAEMLEKLLRNPFPDQPSFFSVDLSSLNPNAQANPYSFVRNETNPTITRAKSVSAHRRDRVPKVLALPKDIRIGRQTVIDSDVEEASRIAPSQGYQDTEDKDSSEESSDGQVTENPLEAEGGNTPNPSRVTEKGGESRVADDHEVGTNASAPLFELGANALALLFEPKANASAPLSEAQVEEANKEINEAFPAGPRESKARRSPVAEAREVGHEVITPRQELRRRQQ